MSDPRSALQAKFSEANRYDNFGDALVQMVVRGVRCHADTVVEFTSPITAFCGLNGTGKSTLLQLAATAYNAPLGSGFHIYDFLVVSQLDPTPFTSDASIEFLYWQADRKQRTLTISRNHGAKRWRGYTRRPKREVLFAGVGLYLPRVEQRDFTVYRAQHLNVTGSSAVSERVRDWTCRILGHHYDAIVTNRVQHSNREADVISVERAGKTYSENHMGYGEGRTQYLVSALERLPERSLILIEEPETSLHPGAQHMFGKYLVDVCMERHHQILLTTHSEFILRSLPSQSRIFLQRTSIGVTPLPGITAVEARSLMTEGQQKGLVVLVEDECARAVVREMVRRVDRNLLATLRIHVGGDADTLAKAMRALKSSGLLVAAVRDGDQHASPKDNMFKLPGTAPPEQEIFFAGAVADHVKLRYGFDMKDVMVSLNGVDHHEWFGRLAARLNQDSGTLVSELAEVYARALPEAEAANLCALLKEAQNQ